MKSAKAYFSEIPELQGELKHLKLIRRTDLCLAQLQTHVEDTKALEPDPSIITNLSSILTEFGQVEQQINSVELLNQAVSQTCSELQSKLITKNSKVLQISAKIDAAELEITSLEKSLKGMNTS